MKLSFETRSGFSLSFEWDTLCISWGYHGSYVKLSGISKDEFFVFAGHMRDPYPVIYDPAEDGKIIGYEEPRIPIDHFDGMACGPDGQYRLLASYDDDGPGNYFCVSGPSFFVSVPYDFDEKQDLIDLLDYAGNHSQ